MLPRKRSSRVILVGDGVGNGHDPIAFHHFREKAALAAQSLEAGAARRKSEIEWLRGLIEWMGDKCSDLKTLGHDLRYNSESSINVLLQQLIDDPESVEAADDARDLSVIFKTNRTLALLNENFEADSATKDWAKEFCRGFEETETAAALHAHGARDIPRLDARKVTAKQIYCAHLFAGKPFVLQVSQAIGLP